MVIRCMQLHRLSILLTVCMRPRLAQQLRAAHEEVAALTAEAEAQQRLARFDGHLRAGALESCFMSLVASRCCEVRQHRLESSRSASGTSNASLPHHNSHWEPYTSVSAMRCTRTR